MVLALAVFPFFFIACLSGEICSRDERSLWAAFAISSPLGARGQVKAKYYEIFIINSLALIWVTVFDYITAAAYDMTAGIGTSVGLIAMSLSLVLSAVEQPFLMRFGTKAGASIKAMAFGALLMAALVYGLFGDISMFGSVEEFTAWLEALLESESFNRGLTVTLAIEPLLCLAVFYLSYRISCRLYRKGVECYEQ